MPATELGRHTRHDQGSHISQTSSSPHPRQSQDTGLSLPAVTTAAPGCGQGQQPLGTALRQAGLSAAAPTAPHHAQVLPLAKAGAGSLLPGPYPACSSDNDCDALVASGRGDELLGSNEGDAVGMSSPAGGQTSGSQVWVPGQSSNSGQHGAASGPYAVCLQVNDADVVTLALHLCKPLARPLHWFLAFASTFAPAVAPAPATCPCPCLCPCLAPWTLLCFLPLTFLSALAYRLLPLPPATTCCAALLPSGLLVPSSGCLTTVCQKTEPFGCSCQRGDAPLVSMAAF